MNKEFYLGFDTSNYTTSAAVLDSSGEIVKSIRIPLQVQEGARGLRQSDALFAHVKAMPDLSAMLREFLHGGGENVTVKAVGCSAFPRDIEGSYMPCFLPGYAIGEAVAAVLGVPVYHISHQRGHIAAALYGAGKTELMKKEFLAFHVSGGTTDVLHCIPDDELIIRVEEIGGTNDLNAGQLIDRVGVKMGLRFPAGPAMESLAAEYIALGKNLPKKQRISVRELRCDLSGAENIATDIYEKTGDANGTAAFVIDFIGRTLASLRDGAYEKYGRLPTLFAGGVMSCGILQNMLKCDNCFFAPPEFSADNAAGAAILASEKYRLL
jgi:N6-L-threonylcarbamoyladenine synthase